MVLSSKAFKVYSKFDGGHGVSIGENPCLDPGFWCVLHRAFQSHVSFMITQRTSSILENTDKTYQNMLSNCCPTVVQLLSNCGPAAINQSKNPLANQSIKSLHQAITDPFVIRATQKSITPSGLDMIVEYCRSRCQQ